MSPWLHLVTAVSLCLFVACSSNPLKGHHQFDTLITSDGHKLFELVFAAPARDLLQSTRSGNRPPPSDTLSLRHQVNLLEDELEVSGFCRDGYFLLGRYAGETQKRLRGECKDIATETDRQQFSNTIERW